MANPSNGLVKIKLKNEVEGELVSTTDYFFVKIGEAVPLKTHDSNFDLERLPSQPLAVSERFRLIFVAHSSGFFVVRTKDVIDSAKEFKGKRTGSSIQELSLVDVPIGKVHLLALSTDNSILAASVSSDLQFYSVDNLMNKEVKQTFSCSLNGLGSIKDMRWITEPENSFLVLSNAGKLYHGEVGLRLENVMDGVDAVELDVKGRFVAVARNNVLSILSTKFKEFVSISLSFGSWVGDSGAGCCMKVDSIKWVRSDSIMLGCFQIVEDGKEENYHLLVIRSRDGDIDDACSELVVQSFYDIYQGLIDDIVPFGSGPYLLSTYLGQCQLAINANRKNTDQHIMLLGWSVDDYKSEVFLVDIERDNWVPRIELQENGNDNLVLGLCVDNVSIYQKVSVQIGAGERTDLSPYCVLICLTLEGKVIMFHVARLAGSEVSPEVISAVPDEEMDATMKLPVEEGSNFLQRLQEQGPKTGQDMEKNEVILVGDIEAKGKRDLQIFEVSGNSKSKTSSSPYQMPHNEGVVKDHDVKSAAHLQSLRSDGHRMIPAVNMNQQTESLNPCLFGEQNTELGHISSKASIHEQTSQDFTKIWTQMSVGVGSSPGSFTVNPLPAPPGLFSYNNSPETIEGTEEQQNKIGLWVDPERASSRQLSGENVSCSKDSVISSFSTSSYALNSIYKIQGIGSTNGLAAKASGSLGRKPFDMLDTASISPTSNFASRPVQNGGQRTCMTIGNMEPLEQENTVGKSSIRKFFPSNEQQGTLSMHGISNAEPNLSKQFGNINEMIKELDLLLRSIKEVGGFRDACTSSLKISIEALEQGMDTLSQKCKMWMSELDEHLKEVHYLLDLTVQAVARKTYMEGIFKQASDSQQWDLWDRQRLNLELELKRQQMLNLNQDLTNRLIELERHFNALELSKFSAYDDTHVGHGAFQRRYGPSRYINSLHSLYNAMNSQLATAENLSECLSQQMAALCVKSPSEEQKNVKKELFETIGIPYEVSYGSPKMKRAVDAPSSQKFLFCDSFGSKINQASAVKNCEPETETARRKRDSLDQSWTCFEPPKTIVKRMLLPRVQKSNLNVSFVSMDKDVSEKKGGIQDARIKQMSEHSNTSLSAKELPTLFSEFKSPMLQRSNFSVVPSLPASHLSPVVRHTHSNETRDLAAEKSDAEVQRFDLMSNSQMKPDLQMKMPQKSSLSIYSTTETPPLLVKSSETSISDGKRTIRISSTTENISSVTSESQRKHNFPFSAPSTISANSALLGKAVQFKFDKSQPAEKFSAMSTCSISHESLSNPTIQTSSASPFSLSVSSTAVDSAAVSVPSSRSLTSSSTSTNANRTMSVSSASDSPSSILASFISLSDQAPEHLVSSHPYTSALNSTSETLKPDVQPIVMSNLRTDLDSANEAGTHLVEPTKDRSNSKLESLETHDPLTAISSGQSSNDKTISVSSDASASQPERPTDAPMQFSTSFSPSVGVADGKNGGLDDGIADEDGMEEEAPEMGNPIEPFLGSLDGFGIGSSRNPSTPKPNPFGGSFSSVSTSPAGSTIAFSVPSGELFRPASFTIPSPQSSSPNQSTNSVAFSGSFNSGITVHAPSQSVFGQPAQIGSGHQALGSVLGTFGQSRQLGTFGLPGSGFAAPNGFGDRFAGSSSTGGFSSAATGGGFAGISSTGGGFAGIASASGGFAGNASTVDGFSGLASAGGFARAASGGGFGAFSSQQGSGGFAAFGTDGGISKPPEVFQMRK